MEKWRRALPVAVVTLLALWVTVACSSDGGGATTIDAVDASDTATTGDTVTSDTGEPEAFRHEIFTHEIPDGRTGIATGEFTTPAVLFGELDVDAKYAHALTFQMTPMLPPHFRAEPSNGPLILYSDDLDVLVFSPLDNFFATLVDFEDGTIRYGLHGDVDEVPEGYVHRFLVVEGSGMNATIERWGELMRADHGAEPVDRYADPGLSYLGYWTDNGSYYYYNTEDGLNEEETLVAVMADAADEGIPVRYMQLDSWWYFKASNAGILIPTGGLVRWEPQPEMFPNGLTAFQERIGVPMVLHNRMFAVQNDYLDDYDFVVSDEMAFPTSGDIYQHFMDDCVSWNVFTYEQDWLVTQYWGAPWLRAHPKRGEEWMHWMADATEERGMTMQICMASAPHLLQTLDLPTVTTVRTSIDYLPSMSKESYYPQFHIVNMLAWAMRIWPFKDNFQTWSENEPYGEAESLVSSLCGGMVGYSDAIGVARSDVIMRTCREDGVLLKPDRPALPVDAMFLPNARPFTTVTWSEVEGLGRWTYVAAFHIASEHPDRRPADKAFAVMAYEVPIGETWKFPAAVTDWDVDLEADLGVTGEVLAYDWRTGEARVVSGTLNLPPRDGLYDFDYVVLAPIFDNGLALVGETAKNIPLADRRFAAIRTTQDSIEADLTGSPGEQVTIRAYDTTASAFLTDATVTIGDDGTATATLSR